MNNLPAAAETDSKTMFGLLHVASMLQERIEATLTEVDLSMTRLAVLNALVGGGEALTLGELAAAAACVRSNMTQVVDRLEKDGLVRRVADPSDRRVVRAALTPAGVERQKAGEARLARVQAEFGASISPAERGAIDRLARAFGQG